MFKIKQKPHFVELAACQRYCLRIQPGLSIHIVHGTRQSLTQSRFVLPLPTSLRIAPTITFQNIIHSHGVPITTITGGNLAPHGIYIITNSILNMNTTQEVGLITPDHSSGFLQFDAEL